MIKRDRNFKKSGSNRKKAKMPKISRKEFEELVVAASSAP